MHLGVKSLSGCGEHFGRAGASTFAHQKTADGGFDAGVSEASVERRANAGENTDTEASVGEGHGLGGDVHFAVEGEDRCGEGGGNGPWVGGVAW